MRRSITLASLLATAALLLGASGASAFTNVTTGDPVTMQLVSASLSQGSFSKCTASALGLTVTQDAGPGAGGALEIHTASFSGCTYFGGPSTQTPDTTTPWPVTLNGSGMATIQNFNFTLRYGQLLCHYSGDISGTYTQTNGHMVLSGNLTRRSGSSLCAVTSAISGTYKVTSTATGLPVTL